MELGNESRFGACMDFLSDFINFDSKTGYFIKHCRELTVKVEWKFGELLSLL